MEKKYLPQLFDNLDFSLAISTLFCGIVIIILSFFYNIHQYDLGGILLTISILYLVFRKTIFKDEKICSRIISQKWLIINNILFYSCICIILIILHSNHYFRPLSFFILVSFAICSIALEILISNKQHAAIILTKMIIIGLILAGSIYFEFDSIFGVDTWYHNGQIEIYLQNNHIVWDAPATHTRNQYFYFPIFHLAGAIISEMTSLNVYSSIFIGISFFTIISIIFIFLIGKRLLSTEHGLIAALLVVSSEYFISFISGPIPTSLGAAFFILMLYLILQNNKNQLIHNILLMCFSVTLILTHTISAFIFSIVTLSFIILNRIVKNLFHIEKNSIKLTTGFILFFMVLLFYYWNLAYRDPTSTGTFFTQATNSFVNALDQDASFAATEQVSNYSYEMYNYFEYFLDHLGYLLLLSFGITGIFLWTRDKKSVTKFIIIGTIIILFSIVYGSGLMGIRSILPTRWFVFIYSLLVFPAASSIVIITNQIEKPVIKILTLILIFGSISFFMITCTVVNGDSPIYAKEKSQINAFTNSELLAANWTRENFDGKIITDGRYGPLQFPNILKEGKFVALDPYQLKNNEGMTVYRVRPYNFYGGPLQIYKNENIQEEFKEASIVYKNGAVINYI